MTFPVSALRGSLVALVTPMHPDGQIDWDRLTGLLDWHVEAGTAGIVSVGTTGESATLVHSEHNEVIRRTIEHIDGRIPVIAGTGANSTAEAIELTREACASGADACLSVVPYYNKPTQAGLASHFKAIADVSTAPLIAYNVPARTITDLADETLIEIAAHPSVCGVKDATGDMARLARQKQAITKEFVWLSGDDPSSCSYMENGGDGVISVTANIAPAMMSQMIAAAAAGDIDKARGLHDRLDVFHKLQGVNSNPIPVKWALAKTGRIGSGIRLPLLPLEQQHHAAVTAAIEELE